MNARKVLPMTVWSAPNPWRPTWLSMIVLMVALFLFGLGESLIIRSGLGASPWTVLALGIANHVALSVGVVTFLISGVVFLLWWSLRLKAGMGTLCNIVVIPIAIDVCLAFLTTPKTIGTKMLFCIFGVLAIGVASGFYLTCQMGAGPRDGLMVGICERTGRRVGVVRSLLEASACFIGWCLGGVVGVGTLVFAFGVGYVLQYALSAINKASKAGKQNDKS